RNWDDQRTTDPNDCTWRITGNNASSGSAVVAGATVAVWSVIRRGKRLTTTRVRVLARFMLAHRISPAILAMVYSIMDNGLLSMATVDGSYAISACEPFLLRTRQES